MPNNYLSVLYQHIIQVENKNVGLKVEGHKHTIAPPVKKVGGGGTCPPPASYASAIMICRLKEIYLKTVLQCQQTQQSLFSSSLAYFSVKMELVS